MCRLGMSDHASWIRNPEVEEIVSLIEIFLPSCSDFLLCNKLYNDVNTPKDKNR